MNHLEKEKITLDSPSLTVAKLTNLLHTIDQFFFPSIDPDFDPTLEGTEVAPNTYLIGQTYYRLDENHPQFKDYSLQTLDSAS